MKKEDFLKDVRHEVEMLKKYGTKKELSRLNFEAFNYRSATNCIYGQMTGKCDNARAQTLMNKSCIRVIDTEDEGIISDKEYSFMSLKSQINGIYKRQTWKSKSFGLFQSRDYRFISALEGYITFNNAKTKNIIDYLQGRKSKLVL